MRRGALCVTTILLATALVACNNEKQPSGTEEQPATATSEDSATKVPLVFASLGELPQQVKDDVTNHFKNDDITFLPVNFNGLEDHAVDDTFPDLVLDINHLATPIDIWEQVRLDLTDFIHLQDMDLNVFDAGLIERLNAYDNKEEHIYELPFSRSYSALFYNKKAFDAMKIAYPHDGMTWKDVAELNKQFAGSSYVGFTPYTSDISILNMMDEYGLHFLDATTDHSTVTSTKWVELATQIHDLIAPAANQGTEAGNPSSARSLFTYSGSIAMALGDGTDLLAEGAKGGQDLDLVSFPTFEEGTKIGPFQLSTTLYVSSTSKHAKEAFQIIAYLLSEERQLEYAKEGFGPAVRTAGTMEQFGASVTGTAGKNVQAFFENSFQPYSETSKYENAALQVAVQQIPGLANPNVSVEEFLRQLDGMINSAVDDSKAAK
ncbi:extracellular solute-binding protein [Paenibacillus rhizovicinus]|uniref:Extracellular solute-binding protein n=1 Tax=Paenibacillus rhizovicinus TaxID=2704463 RepID=A0A6C0P5J6_9BACL|nr:extracellular solute-binding protein [Paenibacillus rhizovicinus]QHW33767.1 extracellular solute-binding protein [Paenibacillus rhizovicinus]